MQRNPWHRLVRTGGAFVVIAVPTLALACFTPRALLALPSAPAHARPVATPSAVAATDAGLLEDWADTAGTKTPPENTFIDAFLLQQAKALSASFSKQVKTLQAALGGLTPGTLAYALVFQKLQLTDAEQAAFNMCYRKTFVKGSSSNLANLQNSLISLQTQFLDANTALSIQQGTQIQKTGSVSAFTPPNFTC